ncbi:ATP-binding protein [Desulfosarcina cetonica]|uniref:ATP-binding protein n=1 Tax=Desulfosarcina cetonica TaxID=90730 RepID=UPI00155DCD08|nr:ATP-binding protein [Desulfosarcina cetonica]
MGGHAGENRPRHYPDYRGMPVLAAWRPIPAIGLGLVIKMDEAEALAPINRLTMGFVVLGLVTFLAALTLSLLVARTISRPIAILTHASTRIAEGDPTVRTDVHTDDEIGMLASAFNDMAAALEQNHKESAATVWLKSGIARLNHAMSGDSPLEVLSSVVIKEIANTLDAQLGAFYLAQRGDQPALSLVGSYAYKKRKNLSNVFKPGEGLVGQAALEKQQIIIGNVPDGYVTVTSGLGERAPRFICVTPFLYEDQVKGVIEIGTFTELTDLQLDYLAQAMDAIAIAVESAQGRMQLTRALEESRALSEKLQSQQEELQASNEELEEQTQRLTMSEERLKAQQEALQAANAELEEKNELLEHQKQEVERGRREIGKKAEELALASKYKSEFLANMSHELRTPLNSLLLLAQGLARNKDGNLTADQVQSAEIVYNSGNDLLNLINEILDLSKIEAGRTDFHFGIVRVGELADGLRSFFGQIAEEKGIKLDISIRPEALAEITSDRQRVEQILRNLVSNAIKFTDQGGVTVTFDRPAPGTDLTRSRLGGHPCLAVSVRDTGIGISQEQQKIIFEAFQQADGSTARRYGGTGLGLSISRELTRLLGGEIQVQSEPGKGSSFTLYLPAAATARDGNAGRMRKQAAKPSYPGTPDPSPLPTPPPPSPPITDDAASIAPGDRAVLVVEETRNLGGFCSINVMPGG